jgi:hypothetical protein
MTLRACLLSAIILAFAFTTSGRTAPEDDKAIVALMKKKVEAAGRTYDVKWKNFREGFRGVGGETLYWWSRRWLEAERELSDKKADQVAACKAHVERMKEHERIIKDLHRVKAATIDELNAAEFYRLEAEIWLAQAKK